MNDGISFTPATIAIIGILLSSVVGALLFVFKLYVASRDSQLAELKEQRDSFKKIAERAVVTLEGEAERRQTARGEVPIPKLAAIAAEHNSPPTQRQKDAAEFSQLNNRQIAAKLALEGPLPPEMPNVSEVKVEIVKVSEAAAKSIKDAASEGVQEAKK